MKPKVIKGDAEYREARAELDRLRALEPGAERTAEMELWGLLIEQYEARRPAGDIPGPSPAGSQERAGTGWRPPLSGATCLFFGGAALLIFLRLAYQGSYFPPFFEGEEGKALDLAKATSEYAAYTHSWWQAFQGGLIEYNKGFSWALVPFYLAFGFDERITLYVLPVIFAVLCASFFTLYRKAYPRSSLLSFVVIILFSVLCVSLRRYKWHPVAYLAALAVYLYFLPHYYRGAFFLRGWWRKGFAVFLFALSCYLYFGCFIYVLPFFILLVFFSTREQRRRELILGTVGLVLAGAAFALTCHTTERWRTRVSEEVGSLRADFSHDGLLYRWGATRDFFTVGLSLPYLVIFLVGLVVSYRRVRRGDRFALINSTLFLCLWAFQVPIGGLNNPDQLNWSMIPLLGVMLLGADALLAGLRDKVRCGSALGCLIVLCVGWNEMRHYLMLNREAPLQTFVQVRNTRTEIGLVLMLIRDDDSGAVRYYLPDPAVPESEGGFGYGPSLPRVDFAPAFAKVTYFVSEADLRAKLRAQPERKPAVVYLGVGYPPDGEKDTVDQPLLGHAPEIVHPFEDIYQISYVIRRFQFHAGPGAAAP